MNSSLCIRNLVNGESVVLATTLGVQALLSLLGIVGNVVAILIVHDMKSWPLNLRFVILCSFANSLMVCVTGLIRLLYHDLAFVSVKGLEYSVTVTSSALCAASEGFGAVFKNMVAYSQGIIVWERYEASKHVGTYAQDHVTKQTLLAAAFAGFAAVIASLGPFIGALSKEQHCFCLAQVTAPSAFMVTVFVVLLFYCLAMTATIRRVGQKNAERFLNFNLNTTEYSLNQRHQIRQLIETSPQLLKNIMTQSVILIGIVGAAFATRPFLELDLVDLGMVPPWFPSFALIPSFLLTVDGFMNPVLLLIFSRKLRARALAKFGKIPSLPAVEPGGVGGEQSDAPQFAMKTIGDIWNSQRRN